MKDLKKYALLLVDIQNDFLPGGALAVTQGDAVIGPSNELIHFFQQLQFPIIASRDWHPPRHISFQEMNGPWPPHAIQNSWGAEFSKQINWPEEIPVFSKGQSPDRDDYSAFAGITAEGMHLEEFLREKNVIGIFIAGLTLEYCVLSTVKEALSKGFRAVVVLDAVRAIDAKEEIKIFQELKSLGCEFTTSKSLTRRRHDEVRPAVSGSL